MPNDLRKLTFRLEVSTILDTGDSSDAAIEYVLDWLQANNYDADVVEFERVLPVAPHLQCICHIGFRDQIERGITPHEKGCPMRAVSDRAKRSESAPLWPDSRGVQ